MGDLTNLFSQELSTDTKLERLDNFPRAVRLILEPNLKSGVCFEIAWERAMECCTPKQKGWKIPEDGITPLKVLENAMRENYEITMLEMKMKKAA